MIKRLLLNTAILSLLVGGIAGAQVITQSVQMSQDPRGPISFDTLQNVYFPGHINDSGKVPTIGGTATPAIVGIDAAGTITMGTSATTATVTFAVPFNSVPNCTVTQQNGTTATYTPATNTLAITQNSQSANKINYVCISVS